MAWSTPSRMASAGRTERLGHGVYRLRGGVPPPQAALRVAWLELAPSVLVWDRVGNQGVVSHRSAATLWGLGDLPADIHEFTLPVRRQTRRQDVRLHRGDVAAAVVSRGGLLVTRPARTIVDLLTDGADPASVSTIVAESLKVGYDGPAVFAQGLSAVAHRYRFSSGDGLGALGWLLDLAGLCWPDILGVEGSHDPSPDRARVAAPDGLAGDGDTFSRARSTMSTPWPLRPAGR